MDTLDRTLLLDLAGRATWPSVSLFMPVDHTGLRSDADRLRLRNLAKTARERLLGDSVDSAGIDALLTGAVELAGDDTVWSGGPRGLAYFAGSAGVQGLWLGWTMPELSVVGDRFYLRPLYIALHEELPVWALALDFGGTRLYRIDRTGIEEVAMPTGTPVALNDEELERSRERTLLHEGHGGTRDFESIARAQFLNDLDRGVVQRIGAGSADLLVVLGVDHLVDEYRSMTEYPHVAPEHVDGSPARLSAAQIRQVVHSALAPRYAAQRQADIDEYHAHAGTGHASSDAAEILVAAASGRVKTLIIDDSAGPWGWFDRATMSVTRLRTREPRYLRDTMDVPSDHDLFDCGWDLIDLAAVETLRHGGAVRAFRGEYAPVHGAAAVFRY